MRCLLSEEGRRRQLEVRAQLRALSDAQVAHRKSDASVLETFDYTYDAVGNPTQLAEASGDVTTWTYDALNQLTDDVRAGGTSYNATFSYDAVG
ncbi:MAG: hypothetical protein FJX74_17225, partial [Armatimonadetes bacterium]|nr:hypothetical protein [Armatimonadota bacterium]